MRKKKLSLVDQLCKECYDLRYVLENESRGSTDDRYKKIVLSILPVLLVRIDTIGRV